MTTDDSNTVDNLILNYLEAKASQEEILTLEAWIQESDENKAYFRQFKNLWEATIELPVSTDKALNKILRQINGGQKHINFWQIFQRVAAVLFIPLLIAMIWLNTGQISRNLKSSVTYNKTVAAFGTFSVLQLPDGSKVWLNSGSSLRYPEKFIGNERNVFLVGEAYFEVHSDKAKPFFVTTPYFSVLATGTKFNVRAEEKFRAPSVTLVEGKVAVQKTPSDNESEHISDLLPSQHFTYDTLTGHAVVQTEDIYKYVAWKDGKLVFRNDNIAEVARRISLQYNVDIEIQGDKIKQYRYRATFQNEPLSELLRLLKISSPIDYKEIKPKELPGGNFSRRKIIIFSSTN